MYVICPRLRFHSLYFNAHSDISVIKCVVFPMGCNERGLQHHLTVQQNLVTSDSLGNHEGICR